MSQASNPQPMNRRDVNRMPDPSADPTALILAHDVSLSLPAPEGEVKILRRIDFTMRAGEAVGLVGRSGSGKTSLLMLLAGLERASAGRICIDGTLITGLGEEALARFRRRAIGIVFQSFHLLPTMTALENVAVPLELAGVADAMGRAGEALEAVGLSARMAHLPSQLSGGEQQRVALARAFAPRPRLLLADEPTGNLDQATGEMVMDLLFAQQRRHGTGLLLITHDPALAARCDRCCTMRDGVLT